VRQCGNFHFFRLLKLDSKKGKNLADLAGKKDSYFLNLFSASLRLKVTDKANDIFMINDAT
jgi:hypothetical protein